MSSHGGVKSRGRKISVMSVATTGKKGWMYKQGGRVKTWKLRFFILNSNTLYYYKKESDSEPKGCISLKNTICTFLNEEATKKENAKAPAFFSVRMKCPFRTYWLCCDKEVEAQSWYRALNDATMISIYDIRDTAKKTGFMIKQGGKFKSWKRRFFILREQSLYYHKNEHETGGVAQGVVALHHARVVPYGNLVKQTESAGSVLEFDDDDAPKGQNDDDSLQDKHPNGLKIINPLRSYVIGTQTVEECDFWIMAINQDVLIVAANEATPIKLGNKPNVKSSQDDDEVSSPLELQQDTNMISATLAQINNRRGSSTRKSLSDVIRSPTSPKGEEESFVANCIHLCQGIYQEEGEIILKSPTQIIGEGPKKTRIDITSPIIVRSFNVKFKDVCIRLKGDALNSCVVNQGEVSSSCVVDVSEKASCYFENCEILYQCNPGTPRFPTCGVMVNRHSQCYLNGTSISGAQHGLIVGSSSLALTELGSITSSSDCVKNMDKGETRMYNTAVVGV